MHRVCHASLEVGVVLQVCGHGCSALVHRDVTCRRRSLNQRCMLSLVTVSIDIRRRRAPGRASAEYRRYPHLQLRHHMLITMSPIMS